MTRDELIQATISKYGFHRHDPSEVAARIDRGLLVGDEVDLGSGIIARVGETEIVAVKDGKEVARKSRAEIGEQVLVQAAFLAGHIGINKVRKFSQENP